MLTTYKFTAGEINGRQHQNGIQLRLCVDLPTSLSNFNNATNDNITSLSNIAATQCIALFRQQPAPMTDLSYYQMYTVTCYTSGAVMSLNSISMLTKYSTRCHVVGQQSRRSNYINEQV